MFMLGINKKNLMRNSLAKERIATLTMSWYMHGLLLYFHMIYLLKLTHETEVV